MTNKIGARTPRAPIAFLDVDAAAFVWRFRNPHHSFGQSSGRVAFAEDTVTDRQSDRVTFVLIARIPPEGIGDFRAYEDAVLPLLPEFNGRLERLLRNSDGTVEMHIISYASDADHQNYRNDPRRTAQASLLKKSNAKLELLPMTSVS